MPTAPNVAVDPLRKRTPLTLLAANADKTMWGSLTLQHCRSLDWIGAENRNALCLSVESWVFLLLAGHGPVM